MSEEQFSLVWNSFPRNLSSGLYTLFTDEQFVDVTLAAEGQILRAHKLILSVCSTYFRDLFRENSCEHPIVILKDVNYRDLSAILHFMYQGEVNIKQEDIASFLKVAEILQINGLTKESDENLDECFVQNIKNLNNCFNDEKEKDHETLDSQKHLCNINKKTIEDVDQQESEKKSSIFTKNNSNRNYEIQNYKNQVFKMDEIESIFDTNNSRRQSNLENPPIDCTADTHQTREADLSNKCNMHKDTEDKFVLIESNERHCSLKESSQKSDFLMDSQPGTFNYDLQTQPYGLNNAMSATQNEFSFDTNNYYRGGRRTIKGIQNSSLPLETTLRVISEIGPTLRMERGKMVRMYSCPWCLRHFTRKENLKLHVRYIHGPLESLTCKLCGNKYKNSNSLRVHSYLYHNTKRDKHNASVVTDGV